MHPKQKQQPHPGAAPQQYRPYPNNGTEGGGVGGGFNISRLPSGPSPASQDPGNKQQPQQQLQPGSMPMGYQPQPRGAQQYNYRPQPPRPGNNMPRMGGLHQLNPQGMQGATVYTFPTGQMLSSNIVQGQVAAGPMLVPTMHYPGLGRHHQPSGQGGGNQGNGYFQPGPMIFPPQSLPPPYSQYPTVYMSTAMRQPYSTPSSAPNQGPPQQQQNQQPTSVQQLYVEQVPPGQQVSMPSLSGGPGPNGTPHMMGQPPSSLSLVQPSVQPGAQMMQNQQQVKPKKLRSKALAVIDPLTGVNILADMGKVADDASQSTDSSASHTPQPQVGKENDDIKAKQVVGEFASKVAAAAFVPDSPPAVPLAPSAPPHEDEKERHNGPVDHAHELSVVKEQLPVAPVAAPVAPQPLHPPAFVPTVSANTKSPPIELHPRVPPTPSMSAVVKQLPPGPSAPHSVPHPTPSPVAPSPTPQPPVVAPTPVPTQTVQAAPAVVPVKKPQPAQVSLQPDPPAPVKKAGVKKEAAPAPPTASERPLSRPAPRPVTTSTPPPSATVTVVGPPPAPAELSRAAPAKPTNFSEQISFKNMGAPSTNTSATLPPAPAPAPAAPTAVVEKGTNGETDVPVGKAIQRPKKKPNHNRKGVDKSGTEMDAFTEPPAPAPASEPTPPPREPTPPAPAPEKQRPVENQTSVIEFFQRDEVEAEESQSVIEDVDTNMDAMVAAKNEENAKVSAAAAANNNNNISEANEEGEVDEIQSSAVNETEDELSNIKSMTIERTPAPAKALQYNYKDGQWSPMNTDGKKMYDRDFLLEIKNSVLALKKPECNLVEYDIYREKPHEFVPNNNRRLHGSSSMNSRGDNGPPPYNRSSSSSQRPMNKIGSRDRGGPSRGVGPSLSLSGTRAQKGFSNYMLPREPEPNLHKDPNAWKPDRLQEGKELLPEEKKQLDKLQKQVRGILNKLTPQNFEKLVSQVLNMKIATFEQLAVMVNLVFEKAVDEPSFSKAYADLCYRLQKQKSSGEAETVNFRKLLLNKCQDSFQKNKNDEMDIVKRTNEIDATPDPEKKKELKLLLEEDERKIRRKSVGLVRFIGELYKLHMLTPNIIRGCIKDLLAKVAEEQLECLCKLLSTIGKELERESDKNDKKEFDDYFVQMNRLAQKSPDSKVSSRIRFMLQDVIELRQRNWKPRRDENNPKTIEQIHKDAERDAALESAMLSTMNSSSKGRHQNDRRNPRIQDNDGWQMSGKSYRANQSYTNTVEPSKLMHFTLSQKDATDTVTLGSPSQFDSWTPGASAKRTPVVTNQGNNFSTKNKYDLLSQADDKYKPYSSMNKGKVSGSTSLEKERGGGMMRDRDRDDRDFRRQGSGPPSRETSRPRYAQPGHSPAGSLNRDRDRDRDFNRMERGHPNRGFTQQPDNRETTESRVPLPEPADMEEDEAERKAATVFEEWRANQDVQETLTTFHESFVGQRNQCLFVRSLMNQVIEGKPHTRTKFAELLVELLQDKNAILTIKDVIAEFSELIKYGDDMVVDIPFFWHHWGQIFSPLVECDVCTFDDIKQSLGDRPLKDRARVLSEIFKTLLLNNKTNLWTASKYKLTDFVPEEEIETFIKSNNFWFLSSSNDETKAEVDKHRETLVKILQKDRDETLKEASLYLDKIKGDVSKKAFVEIVTMAVIKASLKDGQLVEKQFTNFSKLIQKYVDNKEELELICLFAIKNLVMIHEVLQLSVLRESFSLLYDNSIISVEAFKKWLVDTSIEPLESEGRLTATNTLATFFKHIAEADDEEES